jgi:hypothetical protein
MQCNTITTYFVHIIDSSYSARSEERNNQKAERVRELVVTIQAHLDQL